MAQIPFTGDTTPNQADLDANFTELYGLYNAVVDTTSWTPALAVETGLTGSWTYTTQIGRYTKMRKQVIAEFAIAWSAKPSAGQVVLMNLPVAAVAAVSGRGVVTLFSGVTLTDKGGSTGAVLSLTEYNSTSVAFCVSGSALSSVDPRIDVSALGSAGSINGVLIYNAAS